MTEKMIRAKLREVMATADLESITAKEVRVGGQRGKGLGWKMGLGIK